MLLVVDVGNTQTHFGIVPGRGARRALALRHGARVDGRPARRGAAQPARAARRRARRPVGLDRLLDRPAARARVALDGRAVSRPPYARRRSGTEDRHADPDRQSPRARRRPARQRGRRPRAPRRALHQRGLRDGRELRRRLRRRGVPRRGDRAGRRDLARRPDRARRQAPARRPGSAAIGHRQGHRGRDPRGHRVRLRRPGRRHRHPDPRRSSDATHPRSRPAGSPRPSSRPRRPSTKSTSCSR